MSVFGKHYVTKEFSVDAMHQLPNHDGLCKNYHGHTYKIQITLTGLVNEREGHKSEGMVYDFGNLKKIFKKEVESKMDHAFIAKGDEVIVISGVEHNMAQALKEQGKRVTVLGFRSTAENLSKWIFESIQDKLPKNVYVKNVRVYETPTSWADYKARDLD